MDLRTYLSTPGAAADLARSLGVAPAMVAQWKLGKRRVPVSSCIAIERVTKGAVTCEELRDDIDWPYLARRLSLAACSMTEPNGRDQKWFTGVFGKPR